MEFLHFFASFPLPPSTLIPELRGVWFVVALQGFLAAIYVVRLSLWVVDYYKNRRGGLDKRVALIEEIIIKQQRMWERFGLTPEEWWALPEGQRQELMAQEWTVVPSATAGTPVLALSDDVRPESMAEFVKREGGGNGV